MNSAYYTAVRKNGEIAHEKINAPVRNRGAFARERLTHLAHRENGGDAKGRRHDADALLMRNDEKRDATGSDS